MAAGYYLAKNGVKTAIFEKKLSIGGGIWGGAMGFNKIVVQEEARVILDEFGIVIHPSGTAFTWQIPGLYATGMAANALAGAPRMEQIFGGMFLSGRKAALEILKRLGL